MYQMEGLLKMWAPNSAASRENQIPNDSGASSPMVFPLGKRCQQTQCEAGARRTSARLSSGWTSTLLAATPSAPAAARLGTLFRLAEPRPVTSTNLLFIGRRVAGTVALAGSHLTVCELETLKSKFSLYLALSLSLFMSRQGARLTKQDASPKLGQMHREPAGPGPPPREALPETGAAAPWLFPF